MLRWLLALCVSGVVTWVIAFGGRGERVRQGRPVAAFAKSVAPQASAALAAPVPDERASSAMAKGPVIVLDPGHGGSNLGAQGIVPTALEKQVTLAIATQVAARLRAAGATVALTRNDDRALTLRERLEFGEHANATLFVSIHANASLSRLQQGFETYVLSARAIDIDGPALRHDLSRPRPGIDPTTAKVLDDIERGVSQWRSIDIAERMQRALARARPSSLDRGVRQDSQHVLLGATMPAVLVEVGFIDHPREGRELMQATEQANIADALASAITSWLAANKLGPTRP